MQIVVNVINSSGPFLFFNKNVQPSPAHWRQHFILRLGALATASPPGPVDIVFFETVPVNIGNRERTITTRENPSSSAGFEARSSTGGRATNKAL